MNDENWFLEKFHRETYVQGFKIKKKLFSGKSNFQSIDVLETDAVGKLLLLDGKTMISDADEFVYHELMAHIPAAVSPEIKNVLIIGGGDGGIVREFCKHKEIEKIILVEIDPMVVKVCQEFFPDCTSGLKDPRVQVVAQDGAQYVKQTPYIFDVIIIDSTDPENFASTLFTSEFYGQVKALLSAHGIMMAQTENPFLDTYSISSIYQNLRMNFSEVHSLSAPLLIYPGCYWSFAFCSNTIKPTEFNAKKKTELDQLAKDLKWYNTNWHQGCFKLSNYHLKKIGSLNG